MLDVPVLLAAVSRTRPVATIWSTTPRSSNSNASPRGQPERQMGDAVPAEPPEWPRVRARPASCSAVADLRVANLLLQKRCPRRPGRARRRPAAGPRVLGQYWDGVYPLLDADDDNDPTFRINALTGLVAEPLLRWSGRSRWCARGVRPGQPARRAERRRAATLRQRDPESRADRRRLRRCRRRCAGRHPARPGWRPGTCPGHRAASPGVGSAQGLDLGPLRQLLRQALQVFDLYGPQGAASPWRRAPKRPPASRGAAPVAAVAAPAPRASGEIANRETSCASSIACSSITFATSRRARCRCCSSAPRHW